MTASCAKTWTPFLLVISSPCAPHPTPPHLQVLFKKRPPSKNCNDTERSHNYSMALLGMAMEVIYRLRSVLVIVAKM